VGYRKVKNESKKERKAINSAKNEMWDMGKQG
jgi:hypothetical protein